MSSRWEKSFNNFIGKHSVFTQINGLLFNYLSINISIQACQIFRLLYYEFKFIDVLSAIQNPISTSILICLKVKGASFSFKMHVGESFLSKNEKMLMTMMYCLQLVGDYDVLSPTSLIFLKSAWFLIHNAV